MTEERNVKYLLNEWLYDALESAKNKSQSFNIKRIDTRRFWPLLIIILVVSVTITHEAEYAGTFEQDGLESIGWRYAIAINLAIVVGEFFTSWASTRQWAWAVFFVATVGSGLLNIAYVKPWNISNVDMWFAWIYAVLPTIIIVVTGFLSNKVSKIAKTQENRWEKEAQLSLSPKQYKCFCGDIYNAPIELANHTKKHISELKQQSNINNGVDVLTYLKQTYPNADTYPEMSKLNEWAKKTN